MPDIAIARYDAVTGWLPHVCPKHGRPADRWIVRKFYTRTPLWIVPVALLSLLIGAVIALAIRSTDQLRLPGCGECSDADRRRRLIRIGSWIGTLAVFVAALATTNTFLLALSGLGVLGSAIALSSTLDGFGAVTGTLDGPWLKLKGVHPGFVAAMRPNPAWNRPQYVPVLTQYPGAPASYQYPVPNQYAPPHHYG